MIGTTFFKNCLAWSDRGVRRKRIVVVGFVLLVVGGVLWFGTHLEDNVVVVGNLSATDVAEIKRAVHAEMRREVFPSFSWASVNGLPAAAWKYSQSTIRFVTIQESEANEIIVFAGKKRGTLNGYQVIRRQTDGTHITRPSRLCYSMTHGIHPNRSVREIRAVRGYG